jgi:hypothetical protein
MRACRQRFPAVDGANGHDDGNVADLKMADPMLDSDRQYIVLISSLLCTPSQHIQGAGVPTNNEIPPTVDPETRSTARPTSSGASVMPT